jgi:hypothetical protein
MYYELVDYPRVIEITVGFTPENDFRVLEAFGFELNPTDKVLIFGNYFRPITGNTIW